MLFGERDNISMNIMVFDVPAVSGGALSILTDFYEEALKNKKNINWIFVVSEPRLKEKKNVKVLRYPWIKKSWGHRLYFDNIIAPRLIKKYNVDKIFSLQNIIVPFTKVPQILYVHQSLPFVEYRFSLKENKKFWIYQNLIGRKIIKSIKMAEKVIVQTNWMKKSCLEHSLVKEEKIEVIPPNLNIDITNEFDFDNNSLSTFFYPASSVSYKNHSIIINTCQKLKEKNLDNYRVVLTLNGDENENIKTFYQIVKSKKLPVEFIGNLSREEVFIMYTKSILLFPSYIETFGLPMLEAKLHKGIIFASNCAFSHEILDGYENAYYFDPFNSNELFELFLKVIEGKLSYHNVNTNNILSVDGERNLINTVLNI